MKKVVLVIFSIFFALNISACKEKLAEDPQDIVDKAWEKLIDKNIGKESGEFEFDGKANLEIGEDAGELTGKGTVSADLSDPDSPKISLKGTISAEGTLNASSGKIDITGELRSIEENMYLLIDNLVVDTGDAQTTMMVNLISSFYKSQWIEIPNQKDNTLDIEATDFTGEEVSNIAKKHKIFRAEKHLGKRRFKLTIDPQALKDYLRDVAEIQNEEISEENLASIDQLLKELNYELSVGINEDYDIDWVKTIISATDPLEDQSVKLVFETSINDNETDGELDINIKGETPGEISATFSGKHNERSVKIEKPDNVQTLDPAALLGGMGTGLPTEPADPLTGGISMPDLSALEELDLKE